ncbi:unnamed protein product [Cladocopium goreaui]|uniref:Uncharacterized protein n=1 Tax=Cladocopium goreaui TaxID=2562237 RepID=A0A9P1DUS4_9DINO|nr:unnamed protein product [Cladocopium goreaui]
MKESTNQIQRDPQIAQFVSSLEPEVPEVESDPGEGVIAFYHVLVLRGMEHVCAKPNRDRAELSVLGAETCVPPTVAWCGMSWVQFSAMPAVVLATMESPAKKVILFIEELKAEITADMAKVYVSFCKENKSFDTFSSWCNETIAAATANIKTGKETIESCNRRIEELSGFEAAGEAEIKNAASGWHQVAQATKIREKELKAFEASKSELDSSLKAMDEALAEFNSTEASSGAFLQRRSTLPGVLPIRKLLHVNLVNSKMALQDLQLLSKFASSPTSGTLLQGDINGEYNSASGQVIGVIKTTKTDFEEDLKELTDEEAEKKKVHGISAADGRKMMSTLQKEQTDLKSFLVEQKTNAGNSVKELSDKKTLRDETTAQLKAERAVADESLLTETEDTCKEKTYQFGERKKLRDQELKGVTAALEVLSSDDAQATFKSARAPNGDQLLCASFHTEAASFVQLAAARDMEPAEVQGVQQAYHALQQTASEYHSLSLAKLAVQLKTSGSAFRKVLKQIDTQIEFLKAEGEEDVKHKARCLKQMEDSDSAIATLEDTISKAGTKIQRMEGRQAEMEDALKTLQGLLTPGVAVAKETKKDIVDRQEARDKERKDHLEALKHDQDALVLLETAMEQIGKFFKENKIDTGAALIQRHQAEPEKYRDMPDAGFKDADYEGAKGSTKGLMAGEPNRGMMETIKGDMEAEIANGKKQDKENQALYEKDYGALKELRLSCLVIFNSDCHPAQELLDTQKEQELTSTKALADLKSDTETKKEFKDDKTDEKTAAEKNKENLNTDCAWVKTNFDSRREKRQAEIQGLVEAKGVLQAV